MLMSCSYLQRPENRFFSTKKSNCRAQPTSSGVAVSSLSRENTGETFGAVLSAGEIRNTNDFSQTCLWAIMGFHSCGLGEYCAIRAAYEDSDDGSGQIGWLSDISQMAYTTCSVGPGPCPAPFLQVETQVNKHD